MPPVLGGGSRLTEWKGTSRLLSAGWRMKPAEDARRRERGERERERRLALEGVAPVGDETEVGKGWAISDWSEAKAAAFLSRSHPPLLLSSAFPPPARAPHFALAPPSGALPSPLTSEDPARTSLRSPSRLASPPHPTRLTFSHGRPSLPSAFPPFFPSFFHPPAYSSAPFLTPQLMLTPASQHPPAPLAPLKACHFPAPSSRRAIGPRGFRSTAVQPPLPLCLHCAPEARRYPPPPHE